MSGQAELTPEEEQEILDFHRATRAVILGYGPIVVNAGIAINMRQTEKNPALSNEAKKMLTAAAEFLEAAVQEGWRPVPAGKKTKGGLPGDQMTDATREEYMSAWRDATMGLLYTYGPMFTLLALAVVCEQTGRVQWLDPRVEAILKDAAAKISELASHFQTDLWDEEE